MELRVLGAVELRTAGGRLVPLPGPRLRAVLGVLALHANRVVATERLLENVWGQAPPKTARNSLQGHVSRLRRLLAASGEADRLAYREPGYLLRVDPGELDLDEFQRRADDGRRALAASDTEQAAALLRAALGLWRGPLLEGAGVAGLREQLAALEERRLAAVEDRVDADLGCGRHADLVDELDGLTRAHPLRERLRRQQMLALYRSGRPAEALAVYGDARTVLRERLGIDPSPELDRLHRAMLARDPALEPDSVPAREHPVSTEAGKGPATAPSAADAAVGASAAAVRAAPAQAPAAAEAAGTVKVPAHLPAAVSSFTGRAEHLRQLDKLLDDDGGPAANAVVISALAGMAGVGKTALAVHWAHQARERFPDGQLYANLRGWAPGPPLEPLQALAGFLAVLGVPAEQVPTEVEQAAGRYRSLLAGKRVLVVLDNARDADQVRPLLPGSPSCLVLVTSRDRLAGLVALDGARPLDLDVLTPDEARELLSRLLGAERVAAEPEATAELARLCAYLPLALRIAAAHLIVRPRHGLGELVAKLAEGSRLAILEAPNDQRAAVRATFDLSYQTLTPEVRRLFRLLGLAPGPDVSAAAAAALAGTTTADAEGLLDLLADAHLLARPAPGRYAFHDLLRAYAAERCHAEDSAEERDQALGRLLDWYLHTADAAADLLNPERLRLPLPAPEAHATGSAPFSDHAQALAWLDAERANLVAAAQHAAANGPRPAAWRFANTLRSHFWYGMHIVDWLAVAHAGLAAAETDEDLQGQAAAELSLAALHHSQGRYQQAIEHCTRAAALCRQGGWLEGQAAALNNLGLAHLDLGQLRLAADHLVQALELDRRTGSLAGRAVRFANLGTVYLELGRLREAADHHARSLAWSRQAGARASLAIDLANLGGTYHALGKMDEAVHHLDQALSLLRESGNRTGEAEARGLLAAVHRDAGRHAQALELAQAAVALAREVGDRKYEAEALTILATIHQCTGRPDQARARAEQALALAREAGYRLSEGAALVGLAGAELGAGQPDQARQHARQALDLYRETGQRLGEARALVTLGRAVHGDDAEAAVGCWQQALALFTECGSPGADQVRGLLRLGPAQRPHRR